LQSAGLREPQLRPAKARKKTLAVRKLRPRKVLAKKVAAESAEHIMNDMKHIRHITIFAIAALALTGCFKKVNNDTTFIVKPNLQAVSSGELTPAEGVWGYAYYVGEKWEPASYEDAAAMRITNIESGETKEKPAAMSQPYAEDDDTGRIKIVTTSPHVLLVTIYKAGGMYAFRHYDVGENIPQTYLTLQFRIWKTDKYVDSGWTVNTPPATPEPEPTPDPDEGGESGDGSGSDESSGQSGDNSDSDTVTDGSN